MTKYIISHDILGKQIVKMQQISIEVTEDKISGNCLQQ